MQTRHSETEVFAHEELINKEIPGISTGIRESFCATIKKFTAMIIYG